MRNCETATRAATHHVDPSEFFPPARTLDKYEVEELGPEDLVKIIRGTDSSDDSVFGQRDDREARHPGGVSLDWSSLTGISLADNEVEELSQCDLAEITRALFVSSTRAKRGDVSAGHKQLSVAAAA
jgi:hypothetical protein